MAGIGLTLERLTSRGSFAGTFQALVYCCVVSCGPWLFTIICLGAMTWFGARHLDESRIALFGNIVIYNFAFSLVLTGPLTLICTRYLADRLYSRDIRTLNGVYLGAVTLTNVLSLTVSFGFYFFFTDLPLYFVVAATINFVLVSMLWLTSTFLHAIKNFNAFIFTFAVGMIVAFVAGSFLSTPNGALGMLWGFNVGLFIIVFVTIGIGISQYHNDIESPLSFIYYFKKYWDLALSGIIYYMAIWIDKWIMWFAGDNVSTARNVVFNPIYDFPMFLAYLSLIPALSVFMLHTETGFLKHYHLFYREIEAHASYSWLHDRCQRMVDCLLAGLKDIAILQASLTLVCNLIGTFDYRVVRWRIPAGVYFPSGTDSGVFPHDIHIRNNAIILFRPEKAKCMFTHAVSAY